MGKRKRDRQAAMRVNGKTIGVDATTLDANAALRSIVRRDSGESYEEFLTTLAKASRIGTLTRADLARIDRKLENRALHHGLLAHRERHGAH